jgi:hypothetical protein
VLPRVAPHDAQRLGRPRLLRENGGGGEKQPREPRRNEVGEIVEACRGPAEIAVFAALVPDHAVERVRHLVGEKTGNPEQQIPEDRRDDPVREIFGEALDGGAGDAVAVEAQRVAADDVAHRGAPGIEPAPVERRGDRRDVVVEAALRDERRDHQDLERGADEAAAAQPADRIADRGGGPDEQCDDDDAAVAARALAAHLAVQSAIEEGDRPPGEHDRMRHMTEQGRHVAERRVEREAGDEQQQRVVEARGIHRGGSLRSARATVNRRRFCHSGAPHRGEPGIHARHHVPILGDAGVPRFRVWPARPSRNDDPGGCRND